MKNFLMFLNNHGSNVDKAQNLPNILYSLTACNERVYYRP